MSLHNESAKRPCWFYFKVCKCCAKERTLHQCSVLLEGIGYNKPTVEQTQAVWKFVWGKDVASCFSSTTEIRSLLLVLLATDALMVRNIAAWLCESNTTQQKQRTGLIIAFLLGTIIVHLPDMPLWQEIQIKPPDVLSPPRGAAVHETMNYLKNLCQRIYADTAIAS